MPKVVLCGYYGQENAGDEALLLTLLQMLPSTAEPIVLSHQPTLTQQAYGVEAVPHKSLQALGAIAKADWFIWGGGSLMQDVTSLASPLYYGALMKYAQFLGKKTMAWGQGIGPLNRAIARYITRIALQGCQAVSVRDKGSSTLLASWGINHVLAPDPVWALEGAPLDHELDLPTPRIAVTLRSHPLLTPKKVHLLSQSLKQLQQELSASIVLVPFQKSQDLAIAQQLHTVLAQPKTIVSLTHPQQFKSLFAQVDFTIGMRLHSLIIAAAAGSPCFALSYDPKVSQLQQQCQLPGWDLQQLPQEIDLIVNTWLDCYQHRQALSPEQLKKIATEVQRHSQLLMQI